MKKIYVGVILALITLSLATPLTAYVIGISRATSGAIVQHKWKSTGFPIMWRMNPTQGANITGSRTQEQVFQASFAAWQAINTASISFLEGAQTSANTTPDDDNINLITTNPLAASSDFPPGVLALTAASVYLSAGFDPTLQRTIDFAGQIAEADIYFNPTVGFSTNPTATANTFDLQSVATHEIGHLLGLDHSPLLSATMFWGVSRGSISPRNVSTDDAAAVSILYPSSLFASKGKISGTVRTTANNAVYGAVVVAVGSNGLPVASTVTDNLGTYTIEGLDAGTYTVYAEPLDGPITIANISSISSVFGSNVNTSFTTRSR
jgi:hypothetical protein